MKQVVVFNDIAGIAACTLGVALPILSVCDCKVYPMPTAVFSSSTRIAGVQFTSLSGFLPKVAEHWQGIDFAPDAILTGCFADDQGVAPVLSIVRRFKAAGSFVMVDPVMGDDGYVFASPALQDGFRQLVSLADLTCPNFTEFCVLLGADYVALDKASYADKMAFISANVASLDVSRVIITGIRNGNKVCNYVYDNGVETVLEHVFRNMGVCGTGDMFSNIVLSRVLRGVATADAVRFAGEWIEDLAADMGDHPERGLYIGGARLTALRQGILD